MDAATLQAKVYGGYAKAASRVGFVFQQYRPQTANNALDPANLRGSLNAAFSSANQTGFAFNKPNDYKNIEWSGLFDATNCAAGDYLFHATQGTFFIAALQHLLPPLCIQCDRTLSVMRENTSTQAGAVGYGGVGRGNETAIATGFPGGMQWARQGTRPLDDLPSDIIRKGEWFVYLPVIPGVTIKEHDVLVDENGRRLIVMSVYLSDLGYKILAEFL